MSLPPLHDPKRKPTAEEPSRAIRGICDRCSGKMDLRRYEWRCAGCGNVVDRMTHFFRTQQPYQAVIR